MPKRAQYSLFYVNTLLSAVCGRLGKGGPNPLIIEIITLVHRIELKSAYLNFIATLGRMLETVSKPIGHLLGTFIGAFIGVFCQLMNSLFIKNKALFPGDSMHKLYCP